MDNYQHVISVLIINDNKLLLGKRKLKSLVGQYTCPGGKIEDEECVEDAAIREVKEETGLDINNIRLLGYKEYFDTKVLNKINRICFVRADPKHLNIQIPQEESEKCDEWIWFDLDNLPENINSNLKEILDKGKY